MYKILIIALSLVITGCSLKPEMPQIETEFKYSIETSNMSQKWWENFGDEKLNKLVESALKNNSNLQIAALNVEKAKKILSLRNRDFFPTISVAADANRGQSSGETASRLPQMIANNFSLSAILNYEVDLWGRVRDTKRASEAIYKASKYDLDSARLSIASAVATTYFRLIAFNKEKNILIYTIRAYKKTKEYQEMQYNEGAISELTYLQSVGEYESARVKLSNIENNIDLTQGALALLVGESYDNILYNTIQTSKDLPKAHEVPSGISSDILLNRPDVASAYEKIKSANFLIGVARTAYFPTLSLTGAFGYQSDDLDNLFKSNANIWSLGGSLMGRLLDFGRTQTNIELAKLDQNISVAAYDMAVKTALHESRVALNNRKNALETERYLCAFLTSQERIYDLSNEMYDEGYTTQLQLLDAQRILLNAKIQHVESKLSVINSLVEIYKAFGGGFKVNE